LKPPTEGRLAIDGVAHRLAPHPHAGVQVGGEELQRFLHHPPALSAGVGGRLIDHACVVDEEGCIAEVRAELSDAPAAVALEDRPPVLVPFGIAG
jgi:hypothetical protein